MRYFAAIIICLFISVACKSKKEHTTNSGLVKAKADSVFKADSIAKLLASNDSIRLNVAFNSPGYGINGKALKQLEVYIERFETDNNLKLIVYRIPWGREGEVDFCFKLSTINAKKANEFVTGVKNLIGSADRVTMRENCTCRNMK